MTQRHYYTANNGSCVCVTLAKDGMRGYLAIVPSPAAIDAGRAAHKVARLEKQAKGRARREVLAAQQAQEAAEYAARMEARHAQAQARADELARRVETARAVLRSHGISTLRLKDYEAIYLAHALRDMFRQGQHAGYAAALAEREPVKNFGAKGTAVPTIKLVQGARIPGCGMLMSRSDAEALGLDIKYGTKVWVRGA